ncbi:hypothetical protein BH09ACT11_BH09ACT11_05220 [soil metagenome]
MDLDRRRVLRIALAGAAWAALPERAFADTLTTGRSGLTGPAYRPRHAPGMGFPQSLASGDPTPTGAVLWTRVDPKLVPAGLSADSVQPNLVTWLVDAHGAGSVGAMPEGLDTASMVLVEVFEDRPDGPELRPVLVALAPIYADLDHVVKVDLDGHLQPAADYFYRFTTADGYVSRVGHLRTLPSVEATPDRFRIGQVVCQDYTNGYYPALAALAAEDVDLVVHLGDYIYEAVGEASYQGPLPERAISLPSGSGTAQTLADYRHLYATYRSDPALQALHEAHTVVAIWDDHEFANDTYAPAVAPDESLDPDPVRRAAANRAWFEYQPARVPYDPTASGSLAIHRSLRLGRLGELFATDERGYRSPHPCGESTLGQRYFAAGCDQQYATDQTMLGADQREWLTGAMLDSSATWRVWANEVQLVPFRLLGRWLNLDAWDGYAGERDRLLGSLDRAGVSNLVVLTGDLHVFEASLVQPAWQRAMPYQALGAEFMVGSVSSANLAELVTLALAGLFPEQSEVSALRAAGHQTSAPLPVPVVEQIVETMSGGVDRVLSRVPEIVAELQRVVHVENPWIRYFEGTLHGYAVLELTSAAATWSAYAVDTITEPTSPARLLWSGRLRAGRRGLQTLTEAGETDPVL